MFNLPQVNTLTTDLNLCVAATDELDGSIMIVFHQVTRLIYPLGMLREEFLEPFWAHKCCSCFLFIPQVAACQCWAFYHELSNGADGSKCVIIERVCDP